MKKSLKILIILIITLLIGYFVYVGLTISNKELNKHHSYSNCWISINGFVYDITKPLENNPDYLKKIGVPCGVDGDNYISSIAEKNNIIDQISQYKIGNKDSLSSILVRLLVFPILLPGLTIGIILIVILIILGLKFKKTKNKIYFYICILIILLFIFSSMSVSFPRSGKILNALNGDGIEGLNIIRSFEAAPIVFSPGGVIMHNEGYQIVKSDKNGSYSFPLYFNLKIPFLTFFSETNIYSPICDYCIWYENYLIKTDNGIFRSQYTSAMKLIGKNLYIVPTLNNIEECNNLMISEMIFDCKEANKNSGIYAYKDIDDSQNCKYTLSPNQCYSDLAISQNNILVCEYIVNNEIMKNKCKIDTKQIRTRR